MSLDGNIDPASFRQFEHDGWQSAVDGYHRHWETLTSQVIDPMLDALEVSNGVRFLDVATGPGYLAGAAARRGATATGVDFSAEMTSKARQLYPNVEFKEGDAENLPFPDGCFDAVGISFGMLHFSRPGIALKEACRVLDSGGKVAFTVWDTPDNAKAFGIVYDAIRAHGTLDVDIPEGPPFFRFSDPEESKRVMLEAGFIEPGIIRIPLIWNLPSADILIKAFTDGTARTGPTLAAQEPEAYKAIVKTIHQTAKVYEKDGKLEIPVAAILATAAQTGEDV